MSGADAPAPFRIQFDNARDPYTARNALGITSTGGGGGAPTNAEYITAASDPTLTNERVLTDTATVTWDFTTPGQAKANATGGGGGGGNVSNSGTPVVGQYAKWVTSTTIQGISPATVLTDIGAAPLASPTLTGDPKAPTPATADNDTSIATTAYVQAQGYLTTAAATAAYQPLDADLTAIAALTGTNTIYYRSAANTWSAVTVSTGLSFTGGVLTATGGGGTPGGSNTQVQFNDSSAFGGDADLTWNKTTNVLTLTGQLAVNLGNATSILAAGVVECVGGFKQSGVQANLAPASAGVVTLRPNGLASATGQLLVSSSGAVTVNGTIELGAATDTTLSRVSAGVVAIEGQNILTAATGQPLDADLTAIAAIAGVQGDIIYRDASSWTRLAAGTSGQVLQTNGASANPTWVTPAGGGAGNVTVVVQTFTASGTYTPTSGMRYCTIELVGGGGGGGGIQVGAEMAGGGGGGSGGYSRKTVAAATIGASQTVTIGAAGTAGVAAGGTGGAGGQTSVGTICVANGGTGGGGFTGTTGSLVGGLGGNLTGAVGDITAAGAPGNPGYYFADISMRLSGADGGSSVFGGAGRGATWSSTSAVGGAASNYGSGGGGAQNTNAATARAGGAGSAGFVIITEYL